MFVCVFLSGLYLQSKHVCGFKWVVIMCLKMCVSAIVACMCVCVCDAPNPEICGLGCGCFGLSDIQGGGNFQSRPTVNPQKESVLFFAVTLIDN